MKDPRDRGRNGTDPRTEAPTGREALEEIDRRLGGLLGTLTETLGKVVDAVETGEARSRETRSLDARGGLATGSVFRVRVGGLDAGEARADHRSPPADGPARPEEPRPSRPAAAGGGATDPRSPEDRPAGSPRAESRPDEEEPAATRQLRHEVHLAADAWVLTAEAPGASEAGLRLSLRDGVLRVETDGPRPGALEAPAPAGLSLEDVEARLVNGILELRAPRGPAPERGA